jgi:hypothetical protein
LWCTGPGSDISCLSVGPRRVSHSGGARERPAAVCQLDGAAGLAEH